MNEEYYYGWCPLTGELPEVDYIPSEFKSRCVELIYEARSFCSAIEDFPYPLLLSNARYIRDRYDSICQNCLSLIRPYYYTNEKGKDVVRNTLVSENEMVLDWASGYYTDNRFGIRLSSDGKIVCYGSKSYILDVYGEPPDYFKNAILAIITAYEALVNALEYNEYKYEDLLTARELFSIAEKVRADTRITDARKRGHDTIHKRAAKKKVMYQQKADEIYKKHHSYSKWRIAGIIAEEEIPDKRRNKDRKRLHFQINKIIEIKQKKEVEPLDISTLSTNLYYDLLLFP
jgi:hypothetical protein